jgi:DNA mismatch repair protein MutS
MFATHYHELTSLEGKAPGLVNLNTETADTGDDVVFLHRIAEGPASRSYGIHVAKLAGVPGPLLEDAQEKLDQLEEGGGSRLPRGEDEPITGEARGGTVAFAPAPPPAPEQGPGDAAAYSIAQIDMFSPPPEPAPSTGPPAPQLPPESAPAPAPNPLVEKLKALNLMELTPSRAFALLEELKHDAETE